VETAEPTGMEESPAGHRLRRPPADERKTEVLETVASTDGDRGGSVGGVETVASTGSEGGGGASPPP
jgi:hypothetical protein